MGHLADVSNTRSMESEPRIGDEQHSEPNRQVLLCCNGLVISFIVSEHCGTHLVQDTEFPGVVARPIGTFKTSSDYHYQTMRCNVDLLKIIQVGLTLADEHGNFPQEVSTWQFNFHFSIKYVYFARRCFVERGCLRNSTATTCLLQNQLSSFRNPASICSATKRWELSPMTLRNS